MGYDDIVKNINEGKIYMVIGKCYNHKAGQESIDKKILCRRVRKDLKVDNRNVVDRNNKRVRRFRIYEFSEEEIVVC